MWSRAAGISDHDLVDFDFEKDLVEIRSAIVSYGTIVLGKLRLPAVNDAEGEGFVHVRIHDPPNRVCVHPFLPLSALGSTAFRGPGGQKEKKG